MPIPLKSDRSAWDMNYPEKHASDIEEETYTYHLPPPLMDGYIPVISAGQWILSQVPSGTSTSGISTGISRQTILTFAGDLEVCDNPLRIYNRLGVSQTISEIFLSVGTSPTGDDIVVDIHKNGTTILTNQINRPSITATNYTGSATTIDVPVWATGEYLTAHIDQVGSTVAGSDLVVHIIHS